MDDHFGWTDKQHKQWPLKNKRLAVLLKFVLFAGLPLVVRTLKIALSNLRNNDKKVGFGSRKTYCIQ